MAEPRPADKWGSYVQNLNQLDRFMSNMNNTQLEYTQWINRYKEARQQLLQHITIKTTLTAGGGRE
jgi:hypothetical protein